MIGDTRTASNYRLHAEELRTIAEGMADTNTRKVLLSIAEEYERLARALEGTEAPASEKK